MSNAIKRCESYLIKDKQNNIDHNIWPSKNAIIDRMLDRHLELEYLYEELGNKLSDHSLGIVLDAIIHTAYAGAPEKLEQARQDKKEFAQLNKNIASAAKKLAILLRKRSELSEQSLFGSEYETHIVDHICNAASNAPQFKSFLKTDLQRLSSQFLGDRYWPGVPDIVEAIGVDAVNAVVYPSDDATYAGTKSKRPSNRDFFRCLMANIEDNKKHGHSDIPLDFRISDKAIADAGNVCLDLKSEEMISSEDVKNIRHEKIR